VQKITTFLTYEDKAEEAVNFYTSIFKNSKISSIERYAPEVPGMGGKVLSASFRLAGQEFIALDGGPHFKFTDGISLFVSCEDQREVDEYWEKLSAGGEKGQCGWLKDKFGVSWQVIPTALGELITKAEGAKKMAVINAMLKMTKIEIRDLQKAYDEN
jgi:predicted 3-demethylubiquinone-9 3-methyltransferase (glyoxalase superfamily)